MAEIKHNCWTCRFNEPAGDVFSCENQDTESVWRWQDNTSFSEALMPSRSADGCPGWDDADAVEPPQDVPEVAALPDSALNLLDRVAALERAVRALESRDGLGN